MNRCLNKLLNLILPVLKVKMFRLNDKKTFVRFLCDFKREKLKIKKKNLDISIKLLEEIIKEGGKVEG